MEEHGDGDLGTVRQVFLTRASGLGWRGLDALVAACPRLEVVDLSHCVGARDREAVALAAAWGSRRTSLMQLAELMQLLDEHCAHANKFLNCVAPPQKNIGVLQHCG